MYERTRFKIEVSTPLWDSGAESSSSWLKSEIETLISYFPDFVRVEVSESPTACFQDGSS